MAEGDSIRWEATFENLDEATAWATRQMVEQVAKLEAMGEEALASTIRSQMGRVAGPTTGEIEAATAATLKLNEAKRRAAQLDAADLDVVRETTAALEQQAAMRRRLQAEPVPLLERPFGPEPGIALPPERRVRAPEELAGAQIAAEERARIREQLLAEERPAAGPLIVPDVAQRSRETIGERAAIDEINARIGEEAALRERAMAIQRQQLALDQQRVAAAAEETAELERLATMQVAVNAAQQRAYGAGAAAGVEGGRVSPRDRQRIMAGPEGAADAGLWTADQAALARYNIALGEYDGLAGKASIQSEALGANLTRLGVLQSEASNEMRRHGALTTEWLGSLARGESTVSEFGYQVGATVGKFAGWTAAAAGTYAVLGAFTEFGKGAIDSANAVGQLKRTIDDLDTNRAAEDIRSLSQSTDVSIKEAGDAVFQFSRTFHDLGDATGAARQGLSVLQLDNVALADSVKLSTALHQQYGLSVAQLGGVYDMVAASQREYNARISDMVPLLQKSSGAVRNAGGDLTQLIQLSTVGLRLMPGLGGSQLGTAFYRGAATFTRRNAAALVSQYGLGGDINPLTGQGDFTKLLMDAIRESANMPLNRRQNLANLIFGPQYGGRTAALFGPESAALLNQVAGPGARAITTQATRGSLQEELSTQLDQVRKQMEQFVYGLQRVGSALAQTGALTPLGAVLRGVVGTLNLFTDLINTFNELPQPLRQTIDLLVEARLAFLLLTRTRFGASIPGGGRLAQVPGFGAMTETRMRGELATGIRAGLNAVERDIQTTTSQLVANAARQTTLEQQRLQMIQAAGGEENLEVDELERSNAIRARIFELSMRGNELQAQLNAQSAESERLQAQMVGVTATRASSRRFSRTTIESMSAAAQPNAAASAGAAASMAEGDAAIGRVAAAKRRLAVAMTADAAATGELSAATRMMAEVGNREALATVAATETTAAAAAATETTTSLVARVGGLAAGVGRFALAMDPLTIGLVALPFALQLLSGGADHASQAASRVDQMLAQSANSVDQFMVQAHQLAAQLDRQATRPLPSITPPPRVRDVRGGITQPTRRYIPGVGYEDVSQAEVQRQAQPPTVSRSQLPAAEERLANDYRQRLAQFRRDAASLPKTAAGYRQLDQQYAQVQNSAALAASYALAGHPDRIAAAINAFNSDLSKIAANAIETGSKLDPQSNAFTAAYAQIAGLPAPTIEKHIAALDNASKVYGVQPGDLKSVAANYAALVDQFRGASGDPQSMQALTQAQSSVVNVVNKQAQDYLHAASIQTTPGAQVSGIQRAIAFTSQARTQIRQIFSQAIAYAKETGQGAAAIKLLEGAEAQALAGIADAHAQAISALLQATQAQTALRASQVQGISPEADLTRAEVTLSGLKNQLAIAQEHGADASTTAGLMQQINDAQTQLTKQQVDNAQGILQSQEQLRTSQITGITPAADLARAKQNVDNARQFYAFVKGSGLGEKATLDAQAGVDQAVYALNQQLVSNAQQTSQDAAALIQARGQLQQAQTLDPVEQAREQLATDVAVLRTIKPSQFKTYAEYQAAYIQQQARIAQDQRGVTSQIVSTRMQTLQFQFDTQRISEQQYLNGLNALLKLHNLTKQQVQQIQQAIYNTAQSTAVNLNAGNIHLPTTYEVRRAFTGAVRAGLQRGGGQAGQSSVVQNNNTQNHVSIAVHVARSADLPAVARIIDAALDSNLTAQAQAAGVLGS